MHVSYTHRPKEALLPTVTACQPQHSMLSACMRQAGLAFMSCREMFHSCSRPCSNTDPFSHPLCEVQMLQATPLSMRVQTADMVTW